MNSQARNLAESPKFVLAHEYETAFAINRHTGERHPIGEHYGDPTCALISPDEDWFLVGGEGLTFLDLNRGRRDFLRRSEEAITAHVYFVSAMRIDGPRSVRILVDPWSEEASTWQLDLEALAILKVADGPCLTGKPWREDVTF